MKKALLACTLLAALAGCSGSGGGTAATFDPAPWVGTYNGTWQNTTFATTGNSTLTIAADTNAQTMTITLAMTGNVFGAGTPTDLVLSGDYTSTQLTANTAAHHPTYGDVTLTVDGNGNVSGTGTNITGGSVSSMTYTGTISGTSATINYTVQLTGGGTAQGVVNVTKP